MSGGHRRFIHVNRIDTMAGGADDIMARQAFEVCGLPGGAHGTCGRVRDVSVKQRFAFQYVRMVHGSGLYIVYLLVHATDVHSVLPTPEETAPSPHVPHCCLVVVPV
jgi:hypothetical protein